MGARSREGPPEALRRADPMVVPPIVDLTGERPSAELTGEPSIAAVRIMVALTVPITGLVPLRRASRLGRLPVLRRHRAIATTRPIVPRHRTIIRHTDRSPDQSVWKVASGAMGLTAANASPAVRTRAANGCAILCVIASRRIVRRRDGCNGRVVGFNATPSGISRLDTCETLPYATQHRPHQGLAAQAA